MRNELKTWFERPLSKLLEQLADNETAYDILSSIQGEILGIIVILNSRIATPQRDITILPHEASYGDLLDTTVALSDVVVGRLEESQSIIIGTLDKAKAKQLSTIFSKKPNSTSEIVHVADSSANKGYSLWQMISNE